MCDLFPHAHVVMIDPVPLEISDKLCGFSEKHSNPDVCEFLYHRKQLMETGRLTFVQKSMEELQFSSWFNPELIVLFNVLIHYSPGAIKFALENILRMKPDYLLRRDSLSTLQPASKTTLTTFDWRKNSFTLKRL